ncbi:TPA: hypothetical protein ACPY9J_004079 [Yersinia enterocolitica]
MRIETNTNLVFDDSLKECKCILSESQGKVYAFIQALDVGMLEAPLPVRYWGAFDHDYKENSIRRILENGGKWPSLPK